MTIQQRQAPPPSSQDRRHLLEVLGFIIGVATTVGFCATYLEPLAAAYIALGIGFVIGRWV